MKVRSLHAVLVLAVIAAAACGKKSQTVTVKTSDGSVSVTANDTGVALPADFPKDVPIMKGAVVKAVMGSGDTGDQVIIMSAAAPVAEVVSYYQGALKAQGWTSQSNMTMGEGAMLTLKKDGRDLMLTVSKDGKDTNIQLALPSHKG